MRNYTQKRLQELRNMTTEEVAASQIRASTPPRVKAVILRAREKVGDGNDKKKTHTSPKELKDGDVLLKRSSGTLFNKLITGVTGSPHTHAALYSKGKVYDVEKNRGRQIHTFEEFANRDKGLTYDVFRPKDNKATEEAIRNVERKTKQTKGYSYANMVQAGLRDRFGFGITTNFDKNYKICSELVYDCFNGLIGNDAPSSVSPGRLAANQNLEKVHTLRLSIEELVKRAARRKPAGE
jgi:hypothetical protein